jgi:hypothetical protein
MTIQDYDTLVRDVIMYAPHCPEAIATHAVKMTCIDFCRRTHWWRYTSDPIDLEADEKAYQVEVPNGTEPISVIAAWYNDTPLWPMGFSTKNRFQFRNLDSMSGAPAAFSQDDPTQVVLSPVPQASEVGVLVITTAIAPKRSANGADRDMMERYFDGLVHGALARVYAIPNQPFTSPDAALAREKMYRAETTKAKIDANKALTAASLRVQPRHP